MRYTIILDDTALTRVLHRECDTLAQAVAEVNAHLHDHPYSTFVTADVGAPGDTTPRWFIVAERTETRRSTKIHPRGRRSRMYTETLTITPELATAGA